MGLFEPGLLLLASSRGKVYQAEFFRPRGSRSRNNKSLIIQEILRIGSLIAIF